MYLFVTIFILIVCILLAIAVLVQNSKGGGLAANFSAQNQYMGVRKTADFLEKSTWWLAAILIVLSLTATISIPREVSTDDEITTEIDANNAVPINPTAPAPTAAPVATDANAAGEVAE